VIHEVTIPGSLFDYFLPATSILAHPVLADSSLFAHRILLVADETMWLRKRENPQTGARARWG